MKSKKMPDNSCKASLNNCHKVNICPNFDLRCENQSCNLEEKLYPKLNRYIKQKIILNYL